MKVIYILKSLKIDIFRNSRMSKYDEIIKEEPHEKILSISPEKICCQSLVRGWRRYPEPVQFIFVLMFSICIVPRDKIFIDKVTT